MVLPRANGTVDVHGLPPDEVIFGESPQMAITKQKLERVADTNAGQARRSSPSCFIRDRFVRERRS
jgi:hypothetical protein